MGEGIGERRQFGDGPLSQIAGAVYRHLGLTICLALTCLPTLLVLMFLAAAPANLPYLVLAQLPVAPALSAALYAVRAWREDPDDGPFSAFWRGYRRNAGDVLRWWVLAVGVLTVLAVNIAHGDAVAGGGVLRGIAMALAVSLALLSGHLLVITSFFSFRTRDAVRIAVVELWVQWRVTLAMISMLVVAAGVVYLGTGIALMVVAGLLLSLLEHATRPVAAHVAANFIAQD